MAPFFRRQAEGPIQPRMKIRRKAAKPTRSGRPLYVIGYSNDPPTLPSLQVWFDLDYGGPLRLTDARGQGPVTPVAGLPMSAVMATHGPWSVALELAASDAEAQAWKDRVGWGHPHAGQVIPASTTPANACDLVLHAARLARGMTLLTEGTAYDTHTGSYLNPSDWQDRPLSQFTASDHITIVQGVQGEADKPGTEWFHTLGLTKFGRDEIETFRPLGLSSQPVIDRLTDIATELIRLGRQPKVGETLSLAEVNLAVTTLRHRTTPLAGNPVALREIKWEELTG